MPNECIASCRIEATSVGSSMPDPTDVAAATGLKGLADAICGFRRHKKKKSGPMSMNRKNEEIRFPRTRG
eukprot:3665178-Rhodomonas_salina.1